MNNDLYLFVSTQDLQLTKKCQSLKTEKFFQIFSQLSSNTFLFATNENSYPYYFSVINDQQDYSISNEISAILNKGMSTSECDSLVSFAHIVNDHFVAKTDFWGIQHHYYYGDGKTFLCSNNIFLIANLIDAKISEHSLYEFAFFLSPLNSGTWFNNIYLLKPNHAMVFNFASRKLELLSGGDLYDILALDECETDMIDTVNQFFQNVSLTLKGKKSLISLSAGSDSRTVLSAMIKFDMIDHAVSFGRNDFAETNEIVKLGIELNVKTKIFNFADLLSDWNTKFVDSMVLTNGLLNPFRVHYAGYYNLIEGDTLFEGILGSEFIKGEIAVGAMTSKYHKELIKSGKNLDSIIDGHCATLCDDVREKMNNYIKESHSSLLRPLNTEEGIIKYAKFLFNFIPARIFAPLIQLALQNRKVYYPFLSPKILKTIFQSYGIKHYSSLSDNFPGRIKCLIPECLIVKNFNQQIYRLKLDRMVSFKEALEFPTPILHQIARLRGISNRIVNLKHRRRSGQVDHEQLRNPARRFLEMHRDRCDTNIFGTKIENHQFIKEQCTLACLRQIMEKDCKTLIHTLTTQAKRLQS